MVHTAAYNECYMVERFYELFFVTYSTQCFRELEQSQWLFPFKDLQFKGGLGSGAFGIVRKAEVLSTQPGKPPLTVAVKSVKGKHVR